MRTAHLLACASLAMLPPAAGHAASYRFVVLADSATSGVAPIYDRRPSIDEDGSVAFFARSEGFTSPDRLLVARDPGASSVDDYTVIATKDFTVGGDRIGAFTGGRLAFIDNQGAPPNSIIYRASGGLPEPVAIVGFDGANDPPAMNPQGDVVFLEGRSVVVTDGDIREVIAQFETEYNDGSVIDNIIRPAPDIDGTGRVAFFASIRQPGDEPADFICDDLILLSGTDPPLQIADGGSLGSDCAFLSLNTSIPIAVNNESSTAFAASVSSPTVGSLSAVFLDEQVVWDQARTGFPPTNSGAVQAVALNDAGTVAFLLRFEDGLDHALYVGSDPLGDRVLGRGDALCGGVVADLQFHRFGLNDADELAIGVRLMDNRRLILRAEPSMLEPGACITPVPEPLGGSLVAAAVLAALAGRRALAPRGA